MLSPELTTVLAGAGWYDKFDEYLAEGLTDGRQYVKLHAISTKNGPASLMSRPLAFLIKKNPLGIGPRFFAVTLKTSVMMDDRDFECDTEEAFAKAVDNIMDPLPEGFKNSPTVKASPVRVGINVDSLLPIGTNQSEQSDVIKSYMDDYLTAIENLFGIQIPNKEPKAMALTEATFHQLIGLQTAGSTTDHVSH